MERVAAGATAAAVQRVLQNRGFKVVSVRPAQSGWRWVYRSLPTFFRVRRADIILFSRQLATFIRVGVPVTDAIKLLHDSSNSGPFRAALDDITEDLDAGESLSTAIAHHPNVFNQLYVDMVRAAEYSGTLDRVLAQVASHFQRQDSAVKKLRSAMIYPAVILVLALAVCTILIVFVLPNFVSIFHEFRAQLPLPTRIMLAVGVFAQTWRAQILIGIAAVAVGIAAFLSSGPGHVVRDYTVIRLPLIGSIVTYSIIERFTRTLATMLRAGIPISETFDVAIASAGNIRYRRGLESVKQRMVTGDGFSRPLEATGLLAPMMIRMIRVGEETGSLDSSLEQIADFLAEEMDYKVKNMIALIEPGLVIVVGAAVGFVAVSVILPMYGLLKAVH
ncbi:MAG: type II secretion system F family protein [Candidatus Dormibacterales bacterium]